MLFANTDGPLNAPIDVSLGNTRCKFTMDLFFPPRSRLAISSVAVLGHSSTCCLESAEAHPEI
jgi:hypothetical protein